MSTKKSRLYERSCGICRDAFGLEIENLLGVYGGYGGGVAGVLYIVCADGKGWEQSSLGVVKEEYFFFDVQGSHC